MLRKNLLPLAFSILPGSSVAQGSPFGSWAVQGVVVNKTFRPTPLTHSLGVDGIYKLELRDEKNKVRRQMVTRAVILASKIGDEFNDLAAPRKARNVTAAEAKDNALTHAGSDDSPTASVEPKTEIKYRLASVHSTQDMLPEIEGF
jgi:hypothetical protein